MNFFRIVIFCLIIGCTCIIGCDNDAQIVNYNLGTDGDNFKLYRRVVFYNGITDKYILSIEGKCSVNFSDENRFEVTCKTGNNEYKRHFLGRSDNTFPFVEQLDAASASAYHYKVIFKPEQILPSFEINTSINN